MPADACTGYAQALALSEAGEAEAALALLAPLLSDGVQRFEVLALAAALHERLEAHELALALYEKLMAQHGRQVGLCIAMGRVCARMRQPEMALALFDEALARQPQNPDALYNRGNALCLLFRREEAIEAYRAVLPLHADYARMALLDIAQQQQALLDFDAARISYLQHFITAGGTVESIGYRLCNEHYVWPQNPAGIAALARQLGNQYADQAVLPLLPPPPPRAPGQRLRIGLVSADLWSHPVGYFSEALLGATAAREVDWFVYNNRALTPDAVTQRLRAHVGVWRDVSGWMDERLARQIREDGIDVLVDLSGYSMGHRLAMFAARPAALQLSWLGFHGTTGLPYIDGVIADPVCVRAGEDHFFTEPLLRLPHTRLCYTPPTDAPPVAPAPVLRNGVITFGCFQYSVKIAPPVLAAWARIAAALPEARWVVGVPTAAESDREHLRRRCEAAGFAPAHLELRGLRPMQEYLAGYADVDLLLDTFPFTGGTTTAEALWMGVPTLTLSSPSMIGRQGEQIMRASRLPEWVTHSVDEYVARAIETARNAPAVRWIALRPALREYLRTTPFFDAERFGRDWIDAVRDLWQKKSASGLPTPLPQPRLIFFVPAYNHPFGGVKVIYENVAALNRLGFRAFTYTPPGSRSGEFWTVEKHELLAWNPGPSDIVIAPEVMPTEWLREVKTHGCALWIFVQNWAYVGAGFKAAGGAEAVLLDGALVVSDSTEEIVRRCLPQLPCWRVPPAVAAAPELGQAQTAIAYMPRKLPDIAAQLLAAWPRVFPDLANVEWIALDGLPHAQVLEQLRRARYFVSLQNVEGLGLPALEAMAAGCLVLGFTGVGGNEYARSDNGLWVADGDGLALLEALGNALRRERAEPGAYDAMRRAGQQMAARYSQAAQDAALRTAFNEITAGGRGRSSAS